ncbi:MAG: tyrosine-type recombinase/integrase [Aliifodinibius sp.]|nr:tyrosine-type recombinase/integrase [Fodinibius sp.]
MVKRYMQKSGLSGSYSCNTLRHTFASHQVMRGVPIYTVSHLLGHKNITPTQIYAHLAPEHQYMVTNYYDIEE